mgnify:CR=1 FL=1
MASTGEIRIAFVPLRAVAHIAVIIDGIHAHAVAADASVGRGVPHRLPARHLPYHPVEHQRHLPAGGRHEVAGSDVGGAEVEPRRLDQDRAPPQTTAMMERGAQHLADRFAGSPLLGASPSPVPGRASAWRPLGAAAGAGVLRSREGWGPSGGARGAFLLRACWGWPGSEPPSMDFLQVGYMLLRIWYYPHLPLSLDSRGQADVLLLLTRHPHSLLASQSKTSACIFLKGQLSIFVSNIFVRN